MQQEMGDWEGEIDWEGRGGKLYRSECLWSQEPWIVRGWWGTHSVRGEGSGRDVYQQGREIECGAQESCPELGLQRRPVSV